MFCKEDQIFSRNREPCANEEEDDADFENQDTVFNPYALSCGHLFCKGCACSAASVLLFEGPKIAPPKSKCPICRVPLLAEEEKQLKEALQDIIGEGKKVKLDQKVSESDYICPKPTQSRLLLRIG